MFVQAFLLLFKLFPMVGNPLPTIGNKKQKNY